jgi:ion channel
MRILVAIIGILLIVGILQDAFETIVLPRRISRSIRLTRLFYKATWFGWSAIGRKIRSLNRKEYYLSLYGPLSLIALLVVWAVILVLGFASLQWGFGSAMNAPRNVVNFGTDFYMSGTTFFTLGLGDVTPTSSWARVLTVIETGTGLGFLALVIGYLPVIYQAFSRRESGISLLDAHAGSPPSAGELLRRHSRVQDKDELIEHLHDWERWCAELLESHLSYQVLMYYRSQHEHQSWLATLTTILDVCALITVSIDGAASQSAWFTFAIARHAAVDLAQIFSDKAPTAPIDRLSSADFAQLREFLATTGIALRDAEMGERKLTKLRNMYEPYVYAMSQRLQMPLPRWISEAGAVDDWQASAWGHVEESIATL